MFTPTVADRVLVGLEDPAAQDPEEVGHKAATLAQLQSKGFSVPSGVVLTRSACERILAAAGLSLAGPSDVADAAARGDLAAVRTLIVQKANVNAAQVDGATALHWAVYRDNLEMADALIRARANVKAANRNGITPLSAAACRTSRTPR